MAMIAAMLASPTLHHFRSPCPAKASAGSRAMGQQWDLASQ